VRAIVRAEGRRANNLALVEAEVDEMASNLRNAQGSGSSGGSVLDTLGLSLFQEKRFLRPLLVGMSLMLFQQVRRWQTAEACRLCISSKHPAFLTSLPFLILPARHVFKPHASVIVTAMNRGLLLVLNHVVTL
jgi:hypothetical protein